MCEAINSGDSLKEVVEMKYIIVSGGIFAQMGSLGLKMQLIWEGQLLLLRRFSCHIPLQDMFLITSYRKTGKVKEWCSNLGNGDSSTGHYQKKQRMRGNTMKKQQKKRRGRSKGRYDAESELKDGWAYLRYAIMLA
jgi:hypothetical protein